MEVEPDEHHQQAQLEGSQPGLQSRTATDQLDVSLSQSQSS
jgi:hypothetical protein